jgi:hypothetical protein
LSVVFFPDFDNASPKISPKDFNFDGAVSKVIKTFTAKAQGIYAKDAKH